MTLVALAAADAGDPITGHGLVRLCVRDSGNEIEGLTTCGLTTRRAKSDEAYGSHDLKGYPHVRKPHAPSESRHRRRPERDGKHRRHAWNDPCRAHCVRLASRRFAAADALNPCRAPDDPDHTPGINH